MKKLDLDLMGMRKYIASQKLLCYGAGLSGIRVINILENWGKQFDILAFVDRDKSKWNKKISNGNVSYPIISIEEALKKVNENTTIIITCTTCSVDIIELQSSLNQYVELSDTGCISMVEVSQKQLLCSDYAEIAHQFHDMVIPKKIHYCWFGGGKPSFIQKMIDSWKYVCPEYEIIEWNESNYDISKNKYMKQAYDEKMWGFVSDYARMDIVYSQGGIYLDTDIKILRKPDDLLYQKSFFISDSTFLCNTGNGFGARSGEVLLKEFMDYYDETPFKLEDGSFNKAPCMLHQYNVLKRYGVQINDQFQVVCGVNIYPMILGGTNVYTMQIRKSEKAYFAHCATNTWMGTGSMARRKKMREFFECDGLENYDIEM